MIVRVDFIIGTKLNLSGLFLFANPSLCPIRQFIFAVWGKACIDPLALAPITTVMKSLFLFLLLGSFLCLGLSAAKQPNFLIILAIALTTTYPSTVGKTPRHRISTSWHPKGSPSTGHSLRRPCASPVAPSSIPGSSHSATDAHGTTPVVCPE